MELEKGKKYVCIIDNRDICEFEVLRKNKKSYLVKVKDDKRTLYFNESELYFETKQVYAYRGNIVIKKMIRIVTEKQANAFILTRNRNICQDNQVVLQKQINELLEKIEKLQLKRDEQIEKAEYYNNELLKIEEEN